MDTPKPEQTLSSQLDGVSNELKQILKIAKKGFVDIGGEMSRFSNGFATSAATGTSIRERIASDGAWGLDGLKKDIRAVHSEIQGVFAIIEDLVQRQQSFSDEMVAFISWSRSLERLAFIPPIVDHLPHAPDDMETHTLGAIIDNVMQSARPLGLELITSVQEATHHMHQLARRIDTDVTLSRHAVENMTQHTGEAVRHLNQAVNAIDLLCAQLEQRARTVNQVISHLVQNMQTEDISRQRIEHVLDALRMARQKWRRDPDHPDHRRWFVLALHICIAQLEDTQTNLTEGIHQIHDQIEAIHHLSKEAMEDVGNLRHGNRASGVIPAISNIT